MGPLEVPALDVELRQSPSSAIDACLVGLSTRALELIRVPPLVLADRPLEIGLAAFGPHVGACAAASMTHCLSTHALLLIVVEFTGQSCATLSVPVAVHSAGDGWVARALIRPAAWADVASVTVVSLSLAGRPLMSDLLPMTLRVGYNHSPAPSGAVLAAAMAGNVLALEAALAAGGSTEEADEVRKKDKPPLSTPLPRARLLLLPGSCNATPHAVRLSALYWAASYGHLEALRALLAAGASPAASEVVR